MAKRQKTTQELFNQFKRITDTLSAQRRGTWGSDGMPYTESKFEHNMRENYMKRHRRKSSKAHWSRVTKARENADGEANRLMRKALDAMQKMTSTNMATKAKAAGGAG